MKDRSVRRLRAGSWPASTWKPCRPSCSGRWNAPSSRGLEERSGSRRDGAASERGGTACAQSRGFRPSERIACRGGIGRRAIADAAGRIRGAAGLCGAGRRVSPATGRAGVRAGVELAYGVSVMTRIIPLLCSVLGLSLAGQAWADDDDAPAPAAVDTAQPALSIEQEQAVGITVLHPLPASAGERIEG